MKTKRTISYAAIFWVSLFMACYLLSNILAAKPIHIFHIGMTASIFTYPILYFLSHVIREKFEAVTVKRVIWSSVLVMALMSGILAIACGIKGDIGIATTSFQYLFDQNYLIVLASIIAFVVSQWLNTIIYGLNEEVGNHKVLGYLISIAIALFIDALIFQGLSAILIKGFVMDWGRIMGTFTVGLLLSLVLLPLFCAILIQEYRSRQKQLSLTSTMKMPILEKVEEVAIVVEEQVGEEIPEKKASTTRKPRTTTTKTESGKKKTTPKKTTKKVSTKSDSIRP